MLTRARLRTLEAVGALVLAQVLLWTMSFARVASLAGHVRAGSHGDQPGRATSEPRAAGVGRSIYRAAARLPWSSPCLVRALAGRLMLMRRGMPSTLVLGVTTESGLVYAHAWLVVGDGTLCGGRDAGGFTPLATFRANPRA